jgi:hypothetical protein
VIVLPEIVETENRKHFKLETLNWFQQKFFFINKKSWQ